MDAAERLKSKAQELVAKLVMLRGDDSPPFLAAAFVSLLGNVEVKSADLGKRDAVLLGLGGRYIVKLNQGHDFVRQNFSLAHELGHMLLSQLGLAPVLVQDFRGRSHHVKERLCNLVAAELLMPEPIFRSHLRLHGVSLNSLEPLASKFKTSKEATARRIAEVSDEPCIAIYWKLARRPHWPANKLCVVWSAGAHVPGSTGEPTVVRGSSVGNESSVAAAFVGDAYVSGFEPLHFGTTVRKVYVESKGFGPTDFRRAEQRYVLSLVFPQRRPAG